MNDNKKSIFQDKEKRKSLLFLTVFSLAIIFVSSLSIKNSIRKPFDIKGGEKKEVVNNNCADGSCNVDNDKNAIREDNDSLKLIDTDGDGILDWDELFIYGTSPYLEDTDGDGLTDYEEISYKTDPNCFEGRDCSSFIASPVAENSVDDSTPDNLDELYNLLEAELGEDEIGIVDYQKEDVDSEAFSDLFNISPEELRAELLEAGISKDDLDSISDEDLLNIYKESLLDSI